MYTVMIVEDEMFVSAGLKNMIRWSDMDMTVIGEARNGKDGLEMYERMKPDLILTDIKMPVMSGIDMIARIREQDTTTKIVVLSCHEDYELVRQAFKLGISDYILKVKMMPEDIETIIRKIHDELLNEPIKKKEIPLGENPAQVQNVRMEKCKAYIMYQSIPVEEFRAQADELQIAETGLTIGVMEIRSSDESQNAENKNVQNKRQLILELIQNMLSEERRGMILWEKEDRYLLVLHFSVTDTSKGLEAFLEDLLHRISTMICTYINRNAVFGVSSFTDSYEELNRLYTEAVEAEQEAAFLGESIMYYGSEFSSRKYEDILTAFEEQIARADWLTDVCRRKILKESSFQKKVERNDIDTMKEVFRRWIHRISFDSTVQREESLKLAVEAAKQMRSVVSLPELIGIFEKYMVTMSDVKESKLVSVEVAQAVMLIKQHYYEEYFGLSEAANNVGMNKQYLSSLFKKETGQGFSDYLNRIRISKACELLENTTMKSYEISQVVGFQDESYFSRVFKKVIGVRPNEYRRCDLASEELDGREWL